MLPGETIMSGASNVCCGQVLQLKVLRSAAGYYIGTACHRCGPYSRESYYFCDKSTAELALKNDPDGFTWGR